ncbi:tenecin-1-like [Zophobas morio]|uniref:tenecin-1-like n=1 Tax=Zophobas morio TaxID=2755281 RepID=UPI003083748D
MNKLTLAFALAIFAFVCSCQVKSLPAGEEGLHVAESTQQDHVRVKRFTCDILGSDAACSVHCMGHGHRGGYCNPEKVCVCRD